MDPLDQLQGVGECAFDGFAELCLAAAPAEFEPPLQARQGLAEIVQVLVKRCVALPCCVGAVHAFTTEARCAVARRAAAGSSAGRLAMR